MATQLEICELGDAMNEVLRKVCSGEEVTIADHGQPVARIVPLVSTRHPRFGALKGLVEMSEDFNAPLPEEELREWEK